MSNINYKITRLTPEGATQQFATNDPKVACFYSFEENTDVEILSDDAENLFNSFADQTESKKVGFDEIAVGSLFLFENSSAGIQLKLDAQTYTQGDFSAVCADGRPIWSNEAIEGYKANKRNVFTCGLGSRKCLVFAPRFRHGDIIEFFQKPYYIRWHVSRVTETGVECVDFPDKGASYCEKSFTFSELVALNATVGENEPFDYSDILHADFGRTLIKSLCGAREGGKNSFVCGKQAFTRAETTAFQIKCASCLALVKSAPDELV